MTEKVELHHADIAASTQLEVRDIEQWCAFSTYGPGQLHGNLFGRRVQDDRCNLKRRRELDSRNLKRARDKHGRLLRRRELDGRRFEVRHELQSGNGKRRRAADGRPLLL